MADHSYTTHFLPPSDEFFDRNMSGSVPEVNSLESSVSRGLLVGAVDCRRLGAQLRPHIFARLFNLESYRCAGLVSKDLSGIGGHNVLNFGEAALEVESEGARLIHLGCDSTAAGLVSGYHRATEGDEESRVVGLIQVAAKKEMENYVKRRSGQTSPLAYVLAPNGCYRGTDVSFFGLRLPEPSVLEEDQEEHLIYCAGEASFVGVSGKSAEDFLTNRGVECTQMPCGLSVLPRLCGKQMRKADKSEAMQNLRNRFGKGWIAVEVSDVPERMEQEFANALKTLALSKGWGIVAYSARALGRDSGGNRSKWQGLLDDGIGNVCWFDSSNIFEVATMVAASRLYAGSCLDSRIIASAFGVARINTPRADRRNADYCEVWESESVQAVLSDDASHWLEELERAAAVDPSILHLHAQNTAAKFFECISEACSKTGLTTRLFAGEDIEHLKAVLHGQQVAADWMKSKEDRERFTKLNRTRKSTQSVGSVKGEVKRLVKKFTGETQ